VYDAINPTFEEEVSILYAEDKILSSPALERICFSVVLQCGWRGQKR